MRSPILVPGEQCFRFAGSRENMQLFLRFLPARRLRAGPPRSVLYVHGATFPSALSIAHRFDGRLWRDELSDAGFDVWGLDFHGFGFSDRYAEMNLPAALSAPLCDAADAGGQVLAAARFILGRHDAPPRLSLIAHSWGSHPACRCVAEEPSLFDRLVLFGPVVRREASPGQAMNLLPAWRLVSSDDQWKRFVEDVPTDAAPVLSRQHFAEWSECYLDSDPESRTRQPASVKVPNGPLAGILHAAHGSVPYDPARLRAPVAIVRGEWDSLCTDADARALFDGLSASPLRRDVKIGRATHLMHLEAARYALYRESIAFLLAGDTPPTA
jgi:pimeloyl-ACP methyl ester carboxylesterase